MVDKQVLIRKIAEFDRLKEKLDRHASLDLQEFKSDEDLQDIVVFNIIKLVQICIDIGNHILADEDLGIPGTNAEIFRVLLDKKIISKKACDDLVAATGFRNLIVHEYSKIDLDKVFLLFKEKLVSLENFIVEITNKYYL